MPEKRNKLAKYYTPPGSYDGLVRINNRWIRITELNRINKIPWIRWMGPPTRAMQIALKSKSFLRADVAFPEREISYVKRYSI